MSRVLQQSVTFNVPAARLFSIYMDARQHAAATGAPVVVSRKSGSRFSAFGGEVAGRTLAVVPGRLIVQAWRGRRWPKTDADSVLILTFTDTSRGGRVDLVHANVPAHDYAGVKTGWTRYYWQPWKAYLRKSGRK
jgi:activator of HSP90 ATPase